MTVPGVTECRPGTYVYNDRSQVALGSARPEDCAMTILATVVSVPAADRAVVDAGSKTLSTDPMRPVADGHGIVVGRREPRVARVSEEHGVLAVAPGESFRSAKGSASFPTTPAPSRTCTTASWRSAAGGRGAITVAARGCVQ